MVINEGTQTSAKMQNRIVEEGIGLWKRQKEAAHLKKIQEQREMREMLDKYWPWGTAGAQPRGLRNLRLEGLFPNNDFLKAKRLVSPLGLGRPGGGAPVVTHSGKRLVRTKEDPDLRFQWSKDLRKTVDNTLRYKTDKDERDQYKKQLDAQVIERKLRERREKRDDLIFHQKSFLKSPPWGKPGPGGTIWRPPGNIGINFLKSLGWSTERTLRTLEKERERYQDTIRKGLDDFKKLSLQPPNKITKNERVITPRRQDQENIKPRSSGSPRIGPTSGRPKLSPLNRRKVNGEELVPLLAKQRAIPLKIPLGTTDVTRGNPEKRNQKHQQIPNKTVADKWRKPSSPTYLRDLRGQMNGRSQRMKETKADDVEMVRRHFVTLDNFWGRPGHGAPRPIIRKGCLDRLLYDHTIYAR